MDLLTDPRAWLAVLALSAVGIGVLIPFLIWVTVSRVTRNWLIVLLL
jgi:hypothetical protein